MAGTGDYLVWSDVEIGDVGLSGYCCDAAD